MKIFEYLLLINDSQTVWMPAKSKILDIQMQMGVPVMWALIDESSDGINVTINMYRDGYDLGSEVKGEYLATVQDREFVGHYFRI